MRDDVCSLEIWKGRECVSLQESTAGKALEGISRWKERVLREAAAVSQGHIPYAGVYYDGEGRIRSVRYFSGLTLSDMELDQIIKEAPDALIYCFHAGQGRYVSLLHMTESRRIVPVTLKAANMFVEEHHRHHDSVTGCKFAIGLEEGGKLAGVAICGRPVSRILDDGMTLEVNRLCTLSGENACSMLYGACCRIAKDMGYRKVITYILESEPGTSLKASGFVCEGRAGGTHWTGERSRNTRSAVPAEMKTRWVRVFS